MTLTGLTYTCSAGETFDKVALEVYGDEKYACELLNANPKLCLLTEFAGGEILQLPEVYFPPDDNVDEAMPARAPWKEG